MKRIKMNKRQRFIASCCLPLYGGFATREEVKEAKLMARGKYWIEDLEFNVSNADPSTSFCAYSPTGKKEWFDWSWYGPVSKYKEMKWKKAARQAARLWCKGKYQEAYDVYFNSRD